MSKKNQRPPEDLSGLYLETQKLISIELKPVTQRITSSATVTTSATVEMTVKPVEKNTRVIVEAAFTVKASEERKDKEVELLECVIKTLTTYIIPREPREGEDFEKHSWFFAYMAHAFAQRVIKETLIDTEFNSMPFPFALT